MKRKIIVRRPSDEKLEEISLGKGGDYYDSSRVVWDSSQSENVPNNIKNELKESKEKDKTKREQTTINRINRLYLDETDWYILRKVELNIDIPNEILRKRQKARERIIE